MTNSDRFVYKNTNRGKKLSFLAPYLINKEVASFYFYYITLPI